MRFRPLLVALLFSAINVPFARSQSVFDTSNTPATSVSTDYLTGNFTFSLADMGAIQSSGSMNYPGAGQMSWAPGTRPEDLFTVGMLSDYGFQNLSLNQIGAVTGQPISESSLASFPLVQSLTVSQLAQAIPGLAQTPLNQVPPLAALAGQQGLSGGTVGSVAPFVQGQLGQLGGQLVNYGISQIPGLSQISLSQLPGIDAAKISDIPGLSQFPLFNPLSIKDWFVPFDIGFGMSDCSMGGDCHERNIDNTASGNMQDMSIPCMGATQSCAHIEVRRNFANPTQNIRWISKEQQVSGGSGLGADICDKEPTGRFPLGPNPKVVLEKIDEKAGKIEFALYFSVHVDLDESDSAHCFGPFPMPFFGSAKEGQWILFGPDTVPKNSPFASMGQQSGAGGGCSPSGSAAGSGGGTYKGVNIDSLKAAISNRESRGGGGYQAIGIFVNDGAGNTGHGLGKYQFMSYGPAKDIISQKPGGAQFLATAASPSANTVAMASTVAQLFTPQEQETLMNSQLKHLVDVAQAHGLQGDALINRVAEMHTGGEGAGSGVDPQYSKDVIADYNNGGGTASSGSTVASSGCSASAPNVQPVECNGKKLPYIRPTQGPATSEFNLYRVNPVTGIVSPHYGIDLGSPIGTPILSSNCGVVSFTGPQGGYGNFTCINHDGGIQTCYAHQSEIDVKVGQNVKQGEVIGKIGSTGRSTGPHLHFEFRINGTAYNPRFYVPI